MAQQTSACTHETNRREYIRHGCYKCWECGNIIFEISNTTNIDENKKNNMKIYTDEQIKKLKSTLKSIKLLLMSHPDYQHDLEFEDRVIQIDEVLDQLIPIELASDEEICKARDENIPIDEKDMWSERLYFNVGAKWMKEQILNQIK